MKDIKETTDFIVTTTSGTRWAATGTSAANVRENFWMRSPSIIAKQGLTDYCRNGFTVAQASDIMPPMPDKKVKEIA